MMISVTVSPPYSRFTMDPNYRINQMLYNADSGYSEPEPEPEPEKPKSAVEKLSPQRRDLGDPVFDIDGSTVRCST